MDEVSANISVVISAGSSSTISFGSDYSTLTSTSSSVHDYIEKHIADRIRQVYVPVCVFLGIVGNSVSFCVLVMTSIRKTTTCLYMAIIACLDSLVLVIGLLFYLNSLPEFNVYNNWACGPISFVFYFVIHYDVLLLVSMTTERYIAVRFPLKAATLITTKKAVIIIVSLAIFSFAVNCHNFFTRSTVWDTESQQMKCKWEGDMNEFFLTKVHPWIDATLYCFFPMTSLFVLNTLIIWTLRKAERNQMTMTQSISVTPKHGSSNNETHGQGQRQVTIMLMLVSFAFLVLATPVAILIIIEKYVWFPKTAHEVAKHRLTRAIIDNLMYTNHTINFLLYCISGHRFRTELRRLCCRRHQQKATTNVRALPLNPVVRRSLDTGSTTTAVSAEDISVSG